MNNNRSKKSKFIYNEFMPREKNSLIEMFWSFVLETGNSKNSTMRLLPNYSPVIIYCNDRKTNARRLLVTGPLTQNIIFAASTNCIVFGASFKLFAYNKISHYPLLNFKNKLIPFSKHSVLHLKSRSWVQWKRKRILIHLK